VFYSTLWDVEKTANWVVTWEDPAQGPGPQVADGFTQAEAAEFAAEIACEWTVDSIDVCQEPASLIDRAKDKVFEMRAGGYRVRSGR
jgi:hypothetical protein